MTDPSHFSELKDLSETGEGELALMTKVRTSGYATMAKGNDESLIKAKDERRVAQVKQETPEETGGKSMIEALMSKAESLK